VGCGTDPPEPSKGLGFREYGWIGAFKVNVSNVSKANFPSFSPNDFQRYVSVPLWAWLGVGSVGEVDLGPTAPVTTAHLPQRSSHYMIQPKWVVFCHGVVSVGSSERSS
jgi:hypothetical protein